MEEQDSPISTPKTIFIFLAYVMVAVVLGIFIGEQVRSQSKWQLPPLSALFRPNYKLRMPPQDTEETESTSLMEDAGEMPAFLGGFENQPNDEPTAENINSEIRLVLESKGWFQNNMNRPGTFETSMAEQLVSEQSMPGQSIPLKQLVSLPEPEQVVERMVEEVSPFRHISLSSNILETKIVESQSPPNIPSTSSTLITPSVEQVIVPTILPPLPPVMEENSLIVAQQPRVIEVIAVTDMMQEIPLTVSRATTLPPLSQPPQLPQPFQPLETIPELQPMAISFSSTAINCPESTIEVLLPSPSCLVPSPASQIWYVHAKTSLCGDSFPLIDFQKLEGFSTASPCYWQQSHSEAFHAELKDNLPLVIFIHGNLSTNETAVESTMALMQHLTSLHSGGFRLVIWKWDSERTYRGIRVDSQYKAELANVSGRQLAMFLNNLKIKVPITLVGFSFGAKTIGSALTALQNNHKNSSSNEKPCLRYNVLTVSAATDYFDFCKNGCYAPGTALIDTFINLYNMTCCAFFGQ